MSNYFNLELDTTAPKLTIISPNYTTSGYYTEFFIYADEELDENFQEIYFTDILGNRYDCIFSFQDGYFYGLVNFNGFDVGIYTLHVRLSDNVGNISDEYTKSINILHLQQCKVVVDTNTKHVNISDNSNRININMKKNNVKITPLVNNIQLAQNIIHVSIDEDCYNINVSSTM